VGWAFWPAWAAWKSCPHPTFQTRSKSDLDQAAALLSESQDTNRRDKTMDLNRIDWILLANILLVLFVLPMALFSLRKLRKDERRAREASQIRTRDFEEILRVADRISGAKTRKLEEIVEEKKEKFINIPSVYFHFANKEQIRSSYEDYFKEPTIESLVSEITKEISGESKGGVPQMLEARIGGKDLSKWISTIKLPDVSLSSMFLRYQTETIKNGQVTLGPRIRCYCSKAR
jgi:alanyl-tRNA synthetase